MLPSLRWNKLSLKVNNFVWTMANFFWNFCLIFPLFEGFSFLFFFCNSSCGQKKGNKKKIWSSISVFIQTQFKNTLQSPKANNLTYIRVNVSKGRETILRKRTLKYFHNLSKKKKKLQKGFIILPSHIRNKSRQAAGAWEWEWELSYEPSPTTAKHWNRDKGHFRT